MNDTRKELRKFGLVVGGVFAAIGGWLLIRKGLASTGGLVIGALGACLLLQALLVPRTLGPVQFVWMKIAVVLGWINTRIILGVTFYTLVVFARLFLFVTRKDPMKRRFDPALATYWCDLPAEFDPKSYEDPF